MNDPMSRKLFQTRDAREKLRGMGGIMASSPDLAQTVAKFQEGGDVTVPVVPTYNQWLNMSRTERRNAGLPESFIGGQMYFNRFGVGMGTNDPETGLPLRRPEDLAESGFGEFGGLPPYMTEPAGTVEEPRAGQGVFPGDIAFDIGEAVGMGPALERAGVEDPVIARQRRMEEEAAAEEAAAVEAALAATEEEAAAEAPSEDEQAAPAAEQSAPELTLQRAADEVASGEFDFDTTYEQMLGRLGRIMGEDETDEERRQKTMANLAMIGLAIAAGQSPDALTNIAQGALSGVQAMTQQQGRERDLRREAQLTALEMTQSAEDRASRERIAGMRAGVIGEDPRQEYLYNATFSTTYEGLVRDQGMDPAEAVAIARQRAREAAPNAPSARAAEAGVTVPAVGAATTQLTDTERALLGL